MQTCRRVVLFGAGASAGARSEPCPPLGHELLKYVADYLEKVGGPIEWDLSKLKNRIGTEPLRSFEHLANHLSSCPERDLLPQLNFLMACAMTPPLNDDLRVNDAFIEQRDVYDDFLQKNFAINNERFHTSFITLNYDCLLERAICRSFFNGPQDGELRCLCTHVNYRIKSSESKGIEVLKPHGSINWVGNILGGGPNQTSVNYFEPEPHDDRPSYTDIEIVSSPIGKSGDPEGLVIATYAPGKEPQSNPKQLFLIQENAKSCAREAVFVEIIGLHLPTEGSNDDPFLCELLKLMADRVEAGCRVIYVNPDDDEIKRARDYYHFETVQKTFQDYVESTCCVMR